VTDNFCPDDVTDSSDAVFTTILATRYALIVEVDSNGNGTVQGSKVDAIQGHENTIIAVPDEGYHFVGWEVTTGTGVTLGDTTADTTTAVLDSSNATVTASFAQNMYQLVILGDANGTVDPADTVDTGHGDSITITATPNQDYKFMVWRVTEGSADISDSTADTAKIVLNSGDATVTAVFGLITYKLVISTSDANGTVEPADTVDAVLGDSITITATPNSGYQFVVWRITEGSAEIGDSTADTTYIIPSEDVSIQAVFEEVIVSVQPGKGTVQNIWTMGTARGLQLWYSVSEAQQVTIKLFDIKGELLATLVKGQVGTGNHAIDLSGLKAYGPGTYFFEMKTSTGFQKTLRVNIGI
jgi:hypothetical protein